MIAFIRSLWGNRRQRSYTESRNYYDDMYREFDKQDAQSLYIQQGMVGGPVPPEQEALRQRMRQFMTDLRWMHILYEKVILPEIVEFGFVKFKTAERSEYAQRLDLEYERHSNTHDVLRLGYVHLFHKFESYRNDIVRLLDIAHGVSGKEGIVKTMKDYYGIDVDEGGMGQTKLREIAFVANSSKHTDGRPNPKMSTPPRFTGQEGDSRIKVFDFELLADIKAMEQVGIGYFHTLAIVHHRRRLDKTLVDPIYALLPPDQKERLDIEHRMRTGSATWLVRRYFTELPESIKRTWPPDPDPWPLPQSDMEKLFRR